MKRRFQVDLQISAAATASWSTSTPTTCASPTTPTLTLHPESSAPLVLTTSQYMLEPIPSPLGTAYKIRLSEYLSYLSLTEQAMGVALLDVQGDWGVWSTPPQWVRTSIALAVKTRIRVSASPDVWREPTDAGVVASPHPRSTRSQPRRYARSSTCRGAEYEPR